MPAPGHEKDISHEAGQPLRDLNVVREQAPPVLQRAVEGPYDLARLKDCGSATAELTELDAALGPDVAPPGKHKDIDVGGLAGDVVGGALGMPYRGMVRWVTGAAARDELLRAAVLAGMVRRGFIKGRLSLMDCAAPAK
jgi:hypothetical protein